MQRETVLNVSVFLLSYLEQISTDRALEVVRDGWGGRRSGVAGLVDVPDGLVDLLLGVRLRLHLVHHEQACRINDGLSATHC